MSEMNTKDFLIGSLIGGIVGASAALLLAPKSGKELRHDINETAQVAKEKTTQFTNTAYEKSNEFAAIAKDKSSNFAKVVSEQSSNVLEKVRKSRQNAEQGNEIAVEEIAADVAEEIQEVEEVDTNINAEVKEIAEAQKETSTL